LEFLHNTDLDYSRPEGRIYITSRGGYRELACQVAEYRAALSLVDERPFTYKEAATCWYDMFYTPIVQIIRHAGMLRDFLNNTEADLFVWVTTHQRQLS
jgi:hypothetical protein